MDENTQNKKLKLSDFGHQEREAIQIVPIQFADDEGTRRMVLHHARKVIKQHKDELMALSFK